LLRRELEKVVKDRDVTMVKLLIKVSDLPHIQETAKALMGISVMRNPPK